MTVAHDAQTRFPSTNGTTGVNSVDTTTGNRSFTHTPSGTPKGVVAVLVGDTQPTALVTGITYGGLRMTPLGQAVDTSEAAQIWIFALAGTHVPTGAQSVVLEGCTASAKWVTVSTVTAATTGTLVNDTTFVNTTTSTNAQVTQSTSAATLSYGAVASGLAAPPTTAAAGCTLQFQNDTGARAQSSVRRTSEDAAGSPVVGFTTASDDWCAAGVSLAEFTLPLIDTIPVPNQQPLVPSGSQGPGDWPGRD